ncbi:MAG: DUF4153 domain-containing protein [Bacteroidota bacterium]
MKLPALKDLSSNTAKTFIRFPFAILCAVVATIMGFVLVDLPYDAKDLHNELTKGIMTMYLGMLAGISCTVFCEKYFFKSKTQYLFNVLLLLLMHYYYYTLPYELQDKEISRFIVLAIASHLALAFAPFLVDNEPNGFWQYNKHLLLRILIAFFYSHVLYLGLSLALFAIEKLFNFHIETNNYVRLYLVIGGLFNTFFFLSGIPENISSLENSEEYPKGLRIFTQFVLLPLIALYLLILYVYSVKILVSHEWPEGWVAWLVTGYSFSGILAVLLIWPLRLNENYQWIKTCSRFFYLTLFPLIVLLFVSIYIRVKEYGITEQRYFIIVITIWLLAMAGYFLFSKIKNIKIIPLTLFILSIIAAYGPVSAYEISENSQQERLLALLEKNALIKNNKIIRPAKPLSFNDKREISATVNYLVTMHGVYSVQHLFTVDLDSVCSIGNKTGAYIFKPGKVLEQMGIEYTYGTEESQSSNERNYNITPEAVVNTGDYDYLISFTISSYQLEKSSVQKFKIGDKELSIIWEHNHTVSFSVDGDTAVVLPIKQISEKLKNDYGDVSYEIPSLRMQYDLQGKKFSYRCQIKTLNVSMPDSELPKMNYFDGYVLVK